MPNLIGCESSRSQDYQFKTQQENLSSTIRAMVRFWDADTSGRPSATRDAPRRFSRIQVRTILVFQSVFELCDDCSDFGVGRHHRRVDDAELRPPPHTTASALFTNIDDDVDRGDLVEVVARLYHGGAAAILDEQIVGVASEKEIDCAAAKDLVTLFAGDVSNRN